VTFEEAQARSSWLFDNFVNFSPPFNILSGRMKTVLTLRHYQQQPVTYCNGSLQSREDVFEFIIAAESALICTARAREGAGVSVYVCVCGGGSEPQCAVTRTNGEEGLTEKTLTAALHCACVCARVCKNEHILTRPFFSFPNHVVLLKVKLIRYFRFRVGLSYKGRKHLHWFYGIEIWRTALEHIILHLKWNLQGV